MENFATLQKTINTIGSDVKSLGDRFSLLEGRTAAVEKRLDKVEVNSTSLVVNIESVQTSISSLGLSVDEVKQSNQFTSEKYDELLKQSNENKAAIANLMSTLTAVQFRWNQVLHESTSHWIELAVSYTGLLHLPHLKSVQYLQLNFNLGSSTKVLKLLRVIPAHLKCSQPSHSSQQIQFSVTNLVHFKHLVSVMVYSIFQEF